MRIAVKFAAGAEDVLDILAVPFWGMLNGRDTDREYFSPNTDLCLDWFPERRPLLYHHGLDDGPGVSVIGYVDSTSARKTEEGWWFTAQLNKANAYHDQIKQLIAQNALFGSSGAMAHLVRKASDGEILRWPFVELSTTPTPANLLAVVQPADAAKHYKAAGLPWASKAPSNIIPAEHDGGPPVGSYEHLSGCLARLARGLFGEEGYAYVAATFPEFAVFAVYEDDGGQDYYRVPYGIGPDGEPYVTGAPEPLEKVYQPATMTAETGGMVMKSGDPLDVTPLALTLEQARYGLAVAARRTKDVAQRRAQEGRTLSAGHLARLKGLHGALTAQADALAGLLATVDPVQAKAAALQFRHLALLTATLAADEAPPPLRTRRAR